MGILSYMQIDTDSDTAPMPDSEDYELSPDAGSDDSPAPVADSTLSSIITVLPKPIIPCYFCDSTQNGLVRFLNAAAGYNPFLIYINDQLAINGLENGELSDYGRVSVELQMVTITDQNGDVYIEKQINVPVDGAITVAVINTDSGLDLMEIEDMYCNGGINTGCFRVCNLSVTNPKINVMLNSGLVTFRNVSYRAVTSFQYIMTGYYMVSVSGGDTYTRSVLQISDIYIRGNTSYTLYVFNWNTSQDAIRIIIVEDRRD